MSGTDAFLNLLAGTLPALALTARPGDRWTDICPRTGRTLTLSRTAGDTLQSGEANQVSISSDLGITSIQTPEETWTLVPECPTEAIATAEGIPVAGAL